MGKTKPPIYGERGKNWRSAEPQKISPPPGENKGAPARVKEKSMLYYEGRAFLEYLPVGKMLRVKEHKTVPDLETFRVVMGFLNAEKIESLKELSEGDVVYIAVNNHLIVVVEVSYGE